MPPTTAAWILVFAAATALLWLRRRGLGVALLAGGYALALAGGLLDGRVLLPILLLLVAAYAVAQGHGRWWRVAGHLLFVAVALGLGFHLLPGFHNPLVAGPVRVTPRAVPFTLHLNLDKPLAGFWLLLVWPALRLRSDRWSWLRGLAIGLGAAVVCLGLALALGKVALAPKWPDFTWIWAVNNLLLVCLTEEALFRGYLQEGLTRWLSGRPYGEVLAIAIAAALFGLAHFAGGWGYVAVAGVAGVGYGVAYRQGGLQASVLAHFGLNLVHFSLFTYPMLAG